jgi:arylformamidase
MTEEHKTAVELAYSPSSKAPNYPEHIADYRRLSRPCIEAARVQKIPYGPGDDEWFLSNATDKSEKLFVFIHGGYWQFLSANESVFFVDGLKSADIDCVSINYSLAPGASMELIIAQCEQALLAIAKLYPRARWVLSGSSAGAHLSAMMLGHESVMSTLKSRLKAVVLCSGVFDLRPIVGTYINDALKLTLARALDVSPLYRPVLSDSVLYPRILLAVGEFETDAFKGQSLAYAQYLQQLGLSVDSIHIANRNHFDIVFDLDNPATVLGSYVRGQLSSSG